MTDISLLKPTDQNEKTLDTFLCLEIGKNDPIQIKIKKFVQDKNEFSQSKFIKF